YNVSIVDNNATNEGNELQIDKWDDLSKIRFINSIISHGADNGISNVTIAGDTILKMDYSLVPSELAYLGEGNLSDSPLFTDPTGQDYSLQLESPGVNMG